MNNEETILDFINGFKCYDTMHVLEDTFTKGYCYWFSWILSERFGGEIYYLPIENHFVCKVNNVFYDITGKVIPDEKAYSWEEYKLIDDLESERINKYCIKKMKD